MGRNAFKPTEEQRRQVSLMSSIGIQQVAMAKILGIDFKTLTKYFPDELEVGKAKTITYVAGKLMGNIQKNKEASIFFFLKTQAGWREKMELDVEHSGSITVNVNLDPPDVSKP